jgi:hypothetical protein
MGNKAPKAKAPGTEELRATPQSVFVYNGHGSNELCTKTEVISSAPLTHKTVSEYTTVRMPPNVIVVGIGEIGHTNYSSLQEAFRKLAGSASRGLLLDPVTNKDVIARMLDVELANVRTIYPEIPIPKPVLFINDGRIPNEETFNFSGNVFAYDAANKTSPENVDKSGLYSLDALSKDNKSIYHRITGAIHGAPSQILPPAELKALFMQQMLGQKLLDLKHFIHHNHI